MEKSYEKFIEDMPAYSSFAYWFYPIDTVGNYNVYDKANEGIFVGVYNEISAKFIDTYQMYSEIEVDNANVVNLEDILRAFEDYINRPEYYVASHADIMHDISTNWNLYKITLLGVFLMRAYSHNPSDIDSLIAKFEPCIDWLDTAQFASGPASTQYHESYPGGLCYHSLRVANHVRELYTIPSFNNKVHIDSAILCALVHDWCKIGAYEQYNKNVKDEVTGKWSQVLAYRGRDKIMPMGHGVSSYFLASKFFKLQPDEALAIRWHMGEYNVASNEMNELHECNEKFPLVFLLQFADRLSITEYAQ